MYARSLLPRASAVVLAALLLAGCGDASESNGDFEERGTSGDQTTYEVASQGFSVAVPESWQAISVDEYRDGDVEGLIKENPALEQYVEAFQGPDSLLKFVAVGPNVGLSLNIIVEELSLGMTLEKYSQASMSFVRTQPNVSGDIESERVQLPAGEAVKVSYTTEFMIAGSPQTVVNLSYLLVDDGTAYVLGYHTPPELASTYEDTFADSAQSFRVT